MESFEQIQQQEFAHLTGEIGLLGRRLVEWGWSRDQVLAYVRQLLNDSMDTVEQTGVNEGILKRKGG
jgi:hypothetical protein